MESKQKGMIHMEFQTQSFVPVAFGGDINTYSVARAFYEAYRVKTLVFGKFPTGPSYNSKITEYEDNREMDKPEVMLPILQDLSKRFKQKKILAIGCGDSYVATLAQLKDQLPENVIAPYISFELMDSLQQKERFYELCDKHGIDHPATVIFRNGMDPAMELPFKFPIILKPSNGIAYWEHPFATQEKVYTIHDRDELAKVSGEIFEAGYEDSLILQDMIPGNDEFMRVLTCYSNRKGHVKMMCLGHVLLEEHTPHGKGNHAVIITEPRSDLYDRVKALLEDLHYIGFSNFDIKYDRRDGKYKFFEINTRQGRSNFYVTGSGINIAKLLVEEYILDHPLEFTTPTEEHLWLTVPKSVAKSYIFEEENINKVYKLLQEKKYVNPVFFKGDNRLHRMLRMWKNHFAQKKNFKKYYG